MRSAEFESLQAWPKTEHTLSCRDLAVPKQVKALQGVKVVMLSGGWRHAAAADDAGRMYGWGWNKV